MSNLLRQWDWTLKLRATQTGGTSDERGGCENNASFYECAAPPRRAGFSHCEVFLFEK
jgi:hypothetical protein